MNRSTSLSAPAGLYIHRISGTSHFYPPPLSQSIQVAVSLTEFVRDHDLEFYRYKAFVESAAAAASRTGGGTAVPPDAVPQDHLSVTPGDGKVHATETRRLERLYGGHLSREAAAVTAAPKDGTSSPLSKYYPKSNSRSKT